MPKIIECADRAARLKSLMELRIRIEESHKISGRTPMTPEEIREAVGVGLTCTVVVKPRTKPEDEEKG